MRVQEGTGQQQEVPENIFEGAGEAQAAPREILHPEGGDAVVRTAIPGESGHFAGKADYIQEGTNTESESQASGQEDKQQADEQETGKISTLKSDGSQAKVKPDENSHEHRTPTVC